MANFSYGIITVSDSCHAGTAVDESGPAIKQLLQREFKALKIAQSTVPDDKDLIEKILLHYSDDSKLNCIFTTGGTGFSSRDITPEATKSVIHRECPQLALAMALESFKKTQFAALSRAVCGIRGSTLIINFPGSKKAVVECFHAVQSVLPHALELITDAKSKITETHQNLHKDFVFPVAHGKHITESGTQSAFLKHVCPHKTAADGDKDDRNSPFPMLNVNEALKIVISKMKRLSEPEEIRSPLNLPPFRASIKDGYAVKSSSTAKRRIVLGYISAGEKIMQNDFKIDSCFKINTGAAVPEFADAIVQVEDTKLLKTTADGIEQEIEIVKNPMVNQDIREVGSDLAEGELMFKTNGQLEIPELSMLASVGLTVNQKMPRIAVISTGDELVDPSGGKLDEGQIYDSNSTMLKLLLQKYGFDVKFVAIAKDDYESLKAIVVKAMKECEIIISSGGVSMGDKDFVKPLMKELGLQIHFGRVNMKPGKPMTFASNDDVSFFALPGNPVSAFVTFHLFVLPPLRFMCGFSVAKCKLPTIDVCLQLDKYTLDSRPEYVRAKVTYVASDGLFYASMPVNQMSSRLASLISADVLLHLPGATDNVKEVSQGSKLKATVINQYFISEYKD